jgi:hypothetical protein
MFEGNDSPRDRGEHLHLPRVCCKVLSQGEGLANSTRNERGRVGGSNWLNSLIYHLTDH